MNSAGQNVLSGRVRFDEFELCFDEGVLLHRGRRLRLQPQPLRVLAYLVQRSPAIVTRDELGRHVWEKGVYVDLDQSVNYCVRQIRQALGDSATEPRYVETLPRQGYRFVGVLQQVGVPASNAPVGASAGVDTVLSGEGVPAPIAVEFEDADHSAPSVQPKRLWATRRWMGVGALGALAGVVLLFALRHSFGAGDGSRVESIAVLPIENLSGDPGKEYVADGLTDELTTMLARDSTLRVVSRTSVMQYKGSHRLLPEVARALGVDAVVEGSVATAGTRTHVTLQLIRAENDSHLWAESFDRDVNDGTLAGDAARSIAKRLNAQEHAPPQMRPIAPAAHDAYMQARYLWPTDRMEESGPLFQRAVELQPDYAEAWAGLSNYYGEGIAGDVLDPRTSTGPQEKAAQRALALEPNLAVAHQAMGAVYLIARWDFRNADREVLQAIHLDPNDPQTYYLRGCVLEALHRYPEAIEAEKKSMELDPFQRPESLAAIYLGARMYDEALREIQLRMKVAPNNPGLLYTAADVWRRKGNYRESMESWAKLYTVSGDTKSAAGIRRAYEAGGAGGMTRWQLAARLDYAKTRYVSPVELALYYAQLRDREHALALLAEGLRQRSTDFLWVSQEPAYDFLHGDSRYEELLAKTGPLSS